MVSPLPLKMGWVPVMGVDGGGGEGGVAGEVDVEEVPRPEIKCCHYLPLRENCAHVLSALVFFTPGMMRQML